ncbi:MAG TPA: hypothetical protein VEO00_13450, partial [Actinomycetota bacterium]|nr:hypothetical protein [Actinomycetota bacterium]
MKRAALVVGLVLLAGGGGLFGYGMLAGGGDGDGDEPASFAFTNGTLCEACTLNITTAEVQDRDGSTLFVFGGDWPDTPGEVPGDLRLAANDLELVLHPVDAGFEVPTANAGGQAVDPAEFAVGLQGGAFLLDVRDPLLAAPVDFVFGLWDGTDYGARIPAQGSLHWDGSGAPAPFVPPTSPTPTATETTVAPEEETAQQFTADLARAIQTGDEAFLFERLGQATIARYGEEACRTYAAGIHDPTRAYTVTDVGEPAPWDYVTDGLTTTVPDVVAVAVTGTAEGQPFKGHLH